MVSEPPLDSVPVPVPDSAGSVEPVDDGPELVPEAPGESDAAKLTAEPVLPALDPAWL
jgi:hypothetical protein